MPESFPYDRSSKWLIQHHGDSILRLAGLREAFTWRPLQAEVVQPRKLPDGLLEVQFANQPGSDLFVLEIATYPDQQLFDQILRDTTLVYANRRILPEVLALILHAKGNVRAADAVDLHSRRGWTRWQAGWRVVELWTLSAQELFAKNDVGLLPWIPLTDFAGPPEPVLLQCRERIDQQASPEEHANLLAVAQVLTRLRHKDSHLLQTFGGRQVMIESPLIQELVQELVAENRQQDILDYLEERFGAVPEDLKASLRAIGDVDKLRRLVRVAARCPDLSAFAGQMRS